MRQTTALGLKQWLCYLNIYRSSSVTTNLPASERTKRWQQVAQAR
jgi:hypothetical protein